ncbi:carbohydrate binding family 9 domain-containing protein [Maribacter litopenaei]|uniref:Carbohydrate binding family 9 domain-containing protein n=1 Tax=Maribacter litopenaei TaxID=2976127 RepID=A0ABY5Y6R9_9FLAO|nr:carbohydrate binding family 9 domain-containing protein [Maribacter litopenaei]UWX54047.1 carbohydrate binding family 9 domain-containing protein [Maribacter litopenaei]
MTKFTCTAVLLLSCFALISQNPEKSFTVKHTSEKIQLDGILDDPAWSFSQSAGEFQQYFPSDKVPAQYQTDIRMLTDGTTLFIGITAYSPGMDYVIPSLERDFRAGGNDNISLVFDTFNDGTNAFLFGINPYGVRREALIAGGGQDLSGFTTSWDVKWKAETKIYDNYYTAEIAIPLTSFKFAEGETKWRFQSYRFDMQSNERSNWFLIPQNQSVINLAFMGDMHFERPLGKSRTPVALIPYINAISDKDFTTDERNTKLKVGGDAKISIGNGMNLDVTINPDFSNVEVDAIITNLTRFEVSLPERRQFFIDNNDLFGSFGSIRHSNAFFSGRIGIATDRLGNSVQNDILGGVRLSGKLNKNLRLGFLDIQTAKNEDQEVASNNNLMFALQQKVFSRSNIGMFFINRQAFGNEPYLTPEEEYNRVLGIDYNLASEDNTWNGKYYLHKSYQPGDNEGNLSAGALLSYNSRYWNSFLDLAYIDNDFQSDLGFIPRTDIAKAVGSVERLFWPRKGAINNHGLQVFGIFNWRPSLDYQLADYDIRGQYNFVLKDFTEFGAEYSSSYIYLFDPFDPTGTDGAVQLPGNQEYRFGTFTLGYQSNRANVFAFEGETSIGNFFNGQRFSIGGEATLRLQPKVRISLNVNYDKISLPDPYPSADLWLVSPRFGFTFSKSVFWTTLLQYSNQRDNLGINSRLQWRFAPLSDLFIVYNDNYSVNIFEPKYRSINLKLTYWLNI